MAGVGEADAADWRLGEGRFQGVLIGGGHDRIFVAADNQHWCRHLGQARREIDRAGHPGKEVEEQGMLVRVRASTSASILPLLE